MASAFSIKSRRAPTEEVEFELMDTSSGVQRRVDWKPTSSGLGEFIYQTGAPPSSTSTSAVGGSKRTSASTEQDHPPQPSTA
ncbi:hypothetical protein BKA70DRAFT_1442349 [Coprinopsis sp. MPI-PUGE-AT-0042]|nr:hypothetical protein BKA70DRAFT_1442349 [Coprinopsis sp. MPI-PUGE-AT-0042]